MGEVDFSTIPDAARALIGAQGKRFRLDFPDPLNPQGLPDTWYVTVKGEPYARGYRLPSGAWALYGSEEKGDRNAWFVPMTLRGKRRIVRISVDDLISAAEGWEGVVKEVRRG